MPAVSETASHSTPMIWWQSIRHLVQRVWYTHGKQLAFLEDLAVLIDDGVPAYQAVETIARLSDGINVTVANSLLYSLAEGRYIADGMRGWFSPHVVELVRVGEQGGTLLKSLELAIDSLRTKTTLTASVLSAMLYPFAVIVLAMVVMIFAKHTMLSQFSAIMPVHTWPAIGQDLVAVATWVEHWWWFTLTLLIGLAIVLVKLMREYVGPGRAGLDALPGFVLFRRLCASRVLETLGLLLSNGMVFKQALKLMQLNANPYVTWHLLTMEYHLGSGQANLGDVMNTGLIEETDLMRLRVVAQSRGFEHALIRQGQRVSHYAVNVVKRIARVSGALCLGLAAGMAAFLVLAIYSIATAIGGL